MRRILHTGAAILALAGLAACTQANSPAPATGAAAAPAAAPAATGSAGNRFDGTYSGDIGAPSKSGGSGSPSYCNPMERGVLRVANGQVRGLQLEGPVGADGKVEITGVSAAAVPRRLTGQFEGGRFTGQYVAGSRILCTFQLNLARGG